MGFAVLRFRRARSASTSISSLAADPAPDRRPAGRGLTRLSLVVLATSVLVMAGLLTPALASPTFAASSAKVVIVVGPVGDSQTATYISDANNAAAVARKYTSNVTTIYSPHATWAAVSRALQGANIVVYLGHGNGFPSPYSSTLNKNGMDGFGLNATDNAGNYNWTYYGENYITSTIHLAPNAAVLFSRLCYASGNSEWGAGIPTLSVAQQRVDNYAAAFITAGARAVIADGLGDVGWYISGLFTRHSSVDSLFRAAPDTHNNVHYYLSSRSRGYSLVMDPGTYSYVPDKDPYFRSMVANLNLSTDSVIGTVPTSPLKGVAAYAAVRVRSAASTGASIVATIGSGTAFAVRGAITSDSAGRTWAPVTLASGAKGYVASYLARFTGSASATAPLNVRKSAAPTAAVVTVVPKGARFSVTGSTWDSHYRTWFSVKLTSGATGWVAAWYTTP